MEVLEIDRKHLAVVLNNHFPIVAFAVPLRESDAGPLQFVDGGRLTKALRATNVYQVMERGELEKLVEKKDFAHLSPAEMEQVKHWKPARVGDVVFNFWD